jgi:hypothetical protein
VINPTFSILPDIYNKTNIMPRKRMTPEEKMRKFSITINPEINKQLEDLKINKSKLINWLLIEHLSQMEDKNEN